jgi:hypothetical protein
LKIVLAINYVNYVNYDKNANFKKKKWQEIAIDSMINNKPDDKEVELISINYPTDEVNLPDEFKVCKILERNSKITIGNNRDLPYVKDLFNFCATLDCDVFGYINSDILITKDFYSNFSEDIDAYLFSRTDISDVSVEELNNKQFRVVWDIHPGFDGIFFKKSWWLRYNKFLSNDMILGEPEFDLYYNDVITYLKKNCKVCRKRVLYHVFHDTLWTMVSPGAINNRKIRGTLA